MSVRTWNAFRTPSRTIVAYALASIILVGTTTGCLWWRFYEAAFDNLGDDGSGGGVRASSMVVFGYNDIGINSINDDYSEIMFHPPNNTLRAEIISRGPQPQIVTAGVTVNYAVENNTSSVDKTNFWTYAEDLLGVALESDVGLTGNSLSGTMTLTENNDWAATGIPITPIDDDGLPSTYNIADVRVVDANDVTAQTLAVVPVSTEISCNLCHDTADISTATDILRKHDARHGTDLENSKPVLCADCHADASLNLPGDPNLPTLSHAMHGAHAERMQALNLEVSCFACHPGSETRGLRGVHYSHGLTCTDCHESMRAVAGNSRRPWVDLPKCSKCHSRDGFEFEQDQTLYRHSKGHGNVLCVACHGSPMDIGPSVVAADNLQAIGLQGHAGVINTCTVCHVGQPDAPFFHNAGGKGKDD